LGQHIDNAVVINGYLTIEDTNGVHCGGDTTLNEADT
jgi:hypothetical protein